MESQTKDFAKEIHQSAAQSLLWWLCCRSLLLIAPLQDGEGYFVVRKLHKRKKKNSAPSSPNGIKEG